PRAGDAENEQQQGRDEHHPAKEDGEGNDEDRIQRRSHDQREQRRDDGPPACQSADDRLPARPRRTCHADGIHGANDSPRPATAAAAATKHRTRGANRGYASQAPARCRRAFSACSSVSALSARWARASSLSPGRLRAASMRSSKALAWTRTTLRVSDRVAVPGRIRSVAIALT